MVYMRFGSGGLVVLKDGGLVVLKDKAELTSFHEAAGAIWFEVWLIMQEMKFARSRAQGKPNGIVMDGDALASCFPAAQTRLCTGPPCSHTLMKRQRTSRLRGCVLVAYDRPLICFPVILSEDEPHE